MSIVFFLLVLAVDAAKAPGESAEIAAIRKLLTEGQVVAANIAVSSALAGRSSDPELWNLRGIVQAQQGEMKAARESFHRALRLSPRLTTAWLNLGRTYIMGDREEAGKAIEAYEAVLRFEAHNAEAHHQLALLLEWKGAFRESLAHLDRLPPTDQAHLAAVSLRCADQAGLGHSAAAREAAEKLLREADLQASDVVSILPAVEPHDEAVALFLLEGLEGRGLATEETRLRQAAIYRRREQFDAARAAFESVLKTDPKSVEALTGMAQVAWKEKELEGALGYLAKARDLEPDNAGIHYFFGVICNEMHLPVEARKSLERAIELAPENPFYQYAMGAVRLQWKEASGAIPYFQFYLRAHPEDARGHLALATAYFNSDQTENARTEMNRLESNPRMGAGVSYLRGSIAARQNDLPEAVKEFRQLVTLEPNWATAHAELAALLMERDEVQEARRETESALAIDPNNYTANRILLRLYRAANDPRAADQVKKLQTVTEDTEARMKLLERTIEVRPQ